MRSDKRGILTRLGPTYQLRFERHIPHPPALVWQSVATEAGLSEWFPASPEWDFRPGGKIVFEFPPTVPAGTVCPPGMITAIDEDHTFAFLWGEELMRFELRAIQLGTLLVFTHTIDAEAKPDAALFAAGWQVCFEVLDHYLAPPSTKSKPPQPNRWEIAYTLYTDDFTVRS